jgi:hypothetical protein
MKLKNYYAWLLPFWIITTLLDSISCVVNFVEGEIGIAFIFLILSVAFSFVSGILLQKAIFIHQHNKEVDWLKGIIEELKENAVSQIEPFEEFNNV